MCFLPLGQENVGNGGRGVNVLPAEKPQKSRAEKQRRAESVARPVPSGFWRVALGFGEGLAEIGISVLAIVKAVYRVVGNAEPGHLRRGNRERCCGGCIFIHVRHVAVSCLGICRCVHRQSRISAANGYAAGVRPVGWHRRGIFPSDFARRIVCQDFAGGAASTGLVSAWTAGAAFEGNSLGLSAALLLFADLFDVENELKDIVFIPIFTLNNLRILTIWL
jgi:hypothetical protein